MSSSELSNALNPHVVLQRPRRRRLPTTAPATSHTTPTVRHAQVPHPSAPHRSELELAITLPPSPPPPPVQEAAPVIPPPPKPSPNVAPVVQQFYQVIASARNAATAESKRRVAWEREQEAKAAQAQAQMEQRLSGVQDELAMLKTYLSMHPNLAPPSEIQQTYVDTIPTTARIEPASPVIEPAPSQPLDSFLPPIPDRNPPAEFLQGSSSRPLSANVLDSLYIIQEMPSPALSACTPPFHVPQGPPTPLSDGTSPITPAATPEPESNARKRSRRVLEDDTDYETDSEESDTPPTERALRRKNGHDERCLTIHHALRIHIRKMMKLKHGQDLPESVFEGIIPGSTEPVRFVWNRTTKQSAVNATMKKRIVTDLKAHRNKYKHVPDKEFHKKTLEAAFEQVFTTLRQKHKSQGDATTATRIQRREDHKALKARRLHRKKTKLANRTEARKNVPALAQSAFDGALQPDCMSSEESDGEEPAPEGTPAGVETVQVFRTRGPSWRSARLLRMYGILDTQDKLDKSFKPKRGIGRRVRREGPAKEGFFLPPKGVARWMVSQRWIQEMEAQRPDLPDILRDLIVDPAEPEGDDARTLLGADMSDEEEAVHASAPVDYHAHVSDTSYSLYNALQF